MLEPASMEVPIAGTVSTTVAAVPAVHNPRARKLRSAVWQDFTKERRADGNCVAICNHCKKQLTATSRSGTTHLRNHLAICTTTSTRRAGKRRKLIVRRILNNKASTGRPGEGHASGDDHDNDSTHFDQELSRQDLARMIVQHGYRFSMVDDLGFQKFVKNLQPQFSMVSYDIVRADSMAIYESERLKLQDALLKTPCRVSISVDMWRSSTQMDYLCLTCHYIDHANDEWKLRKKILNFVHVDEHFTANQIASLILEKLQEWGIDRKLAAVVLDNCTSGDSVATELLRVLQPMRLLPLNGNLFHVRSCAHILNLTVEESLEQTSDIINRVREMIQNVKFSQERLQKFLGTAKLLQIDQKLLVLDSPNNWPSAYLMFDSACYYHDVLLRLAEQESHYAAFLTPKEWADVKALTEILDALNNTMEKFPVENPTANLYFNDMCEIHVLLNTWRNSPSPVVAQMAGRMLKKFEGYWDLTRPVMAFASILDPRYKMKSIEYFFQLIYGNDQFTAKATIEAIKQNFTSLCNDYEHSADSLKNPAVLFYSGNSSSCMSSVYSNGNETFSRITLSDARRGLDQYIQESSSGQSLKSDLDMYLEEAVYRQKEGNPDNFDILGWWKSFAAKYPVLSQMARDILAIPVSIIPLDSEARVLNEYLSTMDPSTVEGLVCAQDWLRADTEVANTDGHGDDKAPRGDEMIVAPN